MMAPAIAADTDLDGTYPAAFLPSAPAWQNGLRRGLAPLFWDTTLPSTFFIILSGRVVTLNFLERRNATSLASSAFRRPFRFILPLCVSLAIASIVDVAGGFKNASRFAESTRNNLAKPPEVWDSTVEFLNSVTGLFFNTQPQFTDRALSVLPPLGLLWFVPIVFQQSFTAYTFSVLLPYTILKHKLLGFLSFIVVTYWLGSWGWYTLSGLWIAEVALVYLPVISPKGLPLNKSKSMHLKLWIIPTTLVIIGLTLKYLWASIPSRRNDEYSYHANRLNGSLNRSVDPFVTPYPRIDDYLVASGTLVLLELSPLLQKGFNNFIFRFFGRISFMLVLISGTIFLSLGSLIYVHLIDDLGFNNPASIIAVLFFSCLPVAIVAAEILQRTIDEPSQCMARRLFRFMKT